MVCMGGKGESVEPAAVGTLIVDTAGEPAYLLLKALVLFAETGQLLLGGLGCIREKGDRAVDSQGGCVLPGCDLSDTVSRD
jgi:hypothetical protein